MASIKCWRLLPAVNQGSQDIGRHASETLADEAVEEEVDTGVQQGQHVCHVSEHVEQTTGAFCGWRRGVEVVEYHEGARCPQDSKNGGDGEEDGGGLAGRISTQPEAAATSAQLTHNNGIEGEEDCAGQEVDGGTVRPHQDMLDHCSSAALPPPPSSSSSFINTTDFRQAVPQLRPPVIRSC